MYVGCATYDGDFLTWPRFKSTGDTGGTWQGDPNQAEHGNNGYVQLTATLPAPTNYSFNGWPEPPFLGLTGVNRYIIATDLEVHSRDGTYPDYTSTTTHFGTVTGLLGQPTGAEAFNLVYHDGSAEGWVR